MASFSRRAARTAQTAGNYAVEIATTPFAFAEKVAREFPTLFMIGAGVFSFMNVSDGVEALNKRDPRVAETTVPSQAASKQAYAAAETALQQMAQARTTISASAQGSFRAAYQNNGDAFEDARKDFAARLILDQNLSERQAVTLADKFSRINAAPLVSSKHYNLRSTDFSYRNECRTGGAVNANADDATQAYATCMAASARAHETDAVNDLADIVLTGGGTIGGIALIAMALGGGAALNRRAYKRRTTTVKFN